MKEYGSVVTWGAKSYGGDSSSVVGLLKSGVKEIYSNSRAFAAVKEDGSVITWGDKERGGEMARVSLFGTVLSSVTGQLKSGVKMIYPTDNAFAALKEDGSVITWGRVDYGGGSSAVADHLQDGVKEIYSTDYAFAALKEDGSVITWGEDWDNGGDSSSVAGSLLY